MNLPDIETATRWPHPADEAAGARLTERFAAIGPREAAIAATAHGQAALAALGGNSPFLAGLAIREAATFQAVLDHGAGQTVAAILQEIAALPPAARRAVLAATLRQAKRRLALAVAMADLSGGWALEQVVAALSTFAEAALRVAVDHLLLAAAARGALDLPHPDQPGQGSGFVVLGMGKLGAGELNYSSDIDLVLIYDPAAQKRATDDDGGNLAATFSRLARELVALMEQRDADGYVFRTDLRLRPDPAATAPAVSLPAALIYYESLAQNWERAAMLKARPVAGDIEAGDSFLDAIRPFVWRKTLDFAAIADIHGMKRRIDLHKGLDRQHGLAGFDLKLGQGGIREIEFLAQTLQLVWGGRDAALRDRATLHALPALARARHLSAAAASELAAAYRLLRTAEHRIQMIADRQTHVLPDDLESFAIFMGLQDAAALSTLLAAHLGQVRRHYADLFGALPDAGPDEKMNFSGPDAQPAVLAQLAGLGFANPHAIVAAVQAWQAGRIRALRSERARSLIADVLPNLLDALAAQPQPDAAFARFDQLLARLPAGIQPLSLIERNPALLARIAAVLGAAPALADHLAHNPQALEGLVAPARLPTPARLLRERLADAATLEDAIATLRRTVHEVDFTISADTLEGRVDADTAGMARADLADATMGALLPYAQADIARRFGTIPGGGIAVVALGKAGSREMMAGSDLDLILIYDHPERTAESFVPRGAAGRAVPAAQYYTRLAQTFIAALTAPGAGGPLYAADMRLRPSGNAGPVAVSLAGFRRYHRESAWTWERMAITRARVAAGPAILSERVAEVLRTIVLQPADPAAIRRDAAAMRARLARDAPPRDLWDVKHRAGGLMEVEFIAQTFQLLHAGTHPGIAHPTTRFALARLRDAALLAEDDAALLIQADLLWRTVQGMLRVTLGRDAAATLPEASAEALLRAVGRPDVTDQPALHRLMDRTGQDVRYAFARLIGPPDPSLLDKPA